ncbi:MAG: hypothetical protein AAFO91_12590 [Bacteroidota bacterium]
MKNLLFIFLIALQLPVFAIGPGRNTRAVPADSTYRVWLYDQDGVKIAKGILHSVSDSSLTLASRNAYTRSAKPGLTIPLREVATIEYQELNSARKQFKRRTWISLLSVLVATAVGTSPGFANDAYFVRQIWPLYALTFGVIVTLILSGPILGILAGISFGAKRKRKILHRSNGQFPLPW